MCKQNIIEKWRFRIVQRKRTKMERPSCPVRIKYIT